jgi:hypothetical protein
VNGAGAADVDQAEREGFLAVLFAVVPLVVFFAAGFFVAVFRSWTSAGLPWVRD